MTNVVAKEDGGGVVVPEEDADAKTMEGITAKWGI
jgi:hypothetical protein